MSPLSNTSPINDSPVSTVIEPAVNSLQKKMQKMAEIIATQIEELPAEKQAKAEEIFEKMKRQNKELLDCLKPSEQECLDRSEPTEKDRFFEYLRLKPDTMFDLNNLPINQKWVKDRVAPQRKLLAMAVLAKEANVKEATKIHYTFLYNSETKEFTQQYPQWNNKSGLYEISAGAYFITSWKVENRSNREWPESSYLTSEMRCNEDKLGWEVCKKAIIKDKSSLALVDHYTIVSYIFKAPLEKDTHTSPFLRMAYTKEKTGEEKLFGERLSVKIKVV